MNPKDQTHHPLTIAIAIPVATICRVASCVPFGWLAAHAWVTDGEDVPVAVAFAALLMFSIFDGAANRITKAIDESLESKP